MKQLASSFRKHGFDFVQLKRHGNLAIFYKLLAKGPGKGTGSFEVVRIQQHLAYTIAGNLIEATEALPSSESWGTSGFTCQTRERAEKRLSAMS